MTEKVVFQAYLENDTFDHCPIEVTVSEGNPRPGAQKLTVSLDIPNVGVLHLVDANVVSVNDVEYQTEIDELTAELDKAQDKYHDLEEDNEELQAQIKTLQEAAEQIQQIIAANEELQHKLEALTIENRAYAMTLENEGIFERNPPA